MEWRNVMILQIVMVHDELIGLMGDVIMGLQLEK